MDTELTQIIIYIVAALTAVGVVVFLMVRHMLDPKNIQKELERQAQLQHDAQKDPYDISYSTEEIRATIIDQSCCSKLVGTKTPKAIQEFTVVFRTENSKILSFHVNEEMYDGLEVGQTGLLTIVDGQFYGFAIDA